MQTMNQRVETAGMAKASPDRLTSMDILIVEDSPTQMVALEATLRGMGHRTRAAVGIQDARAQLEKQVPDLVLLDLLLPDGNGVDFIQEVLACAAGQWVPVVLMSGAETNDDVLRALDKGADDFLVKPLHPGLLAAKIRALQHAARANTKLVEVAQMLERYREGAEVEMQLARNLIQHMIKRDGLRDPALEWYVLPSARFSGDIVASARRDNGELYVFLADASGHGLAAAISGLPALQVFYAMAAKGASVGDIGHEMNSKLKEYLPLGRYLAALLLRVDFANRQADIWNGGMPPGLALTAGAAQTSDALVPKHLPLGVAPADLFDSQSARFTWSRPTRLVFFSDGLIEAVNPSGDPFGMQRLINTAVRSQGTGLIAPLLAALRQHMQGTAPHDDVSILGVSLP